MSRFELLDNKIRCNKTSEQIKAIASISPKWSPNNVRRIIIGVEGVIIGYHVVASQSWYSKLYESVSITNQILQEEYQLFKTNGKVKHILSALTSGRICSSVEEIIFCNNSYPQDLLQWEISTISQAIGDTRLTGSDVMEKLRNRFIRLDNISIYACSLQEFYNKVILQDAKSKTRFSLLKDIADNEAVLPVAHRIDFNKYGEWWRTTFNRSKDYAFDAEGGTLDKHFNKIREYYLEEERNAKLDAINAKRNASNIEKDKNITDKYYSSFDKLCNQINTLFSSMNKLRKNIWEHDAKSWGKAMDGKAFSDAFKMVFTHNYGYSSIDMPYFINKYNCDSIKIFAERIYIPFCTKLTYESKSAEGVVTKWRMRVGTGDTDFGGRSIDEYNQVFGKFLTNVLKVFYIIAWYEVFFYIGSAKGGAIVQDLRLANIVNAANKTGLSVFAIPSVMVDRLKALGVEHCDACKTRVATFARIIPEFEITAEMMFDTANSIFNVMYVVGGGE